MEAAVRIQLSTEQKARLDAGGIVAIPATWDEFIDFLTETDYRAEYHNGRLLITGLAAFYHEVLISTIITILSGLLNGKGYFVAGSNVGVFKGGRQGIL